jgi:AAA15 family ATPase/GTPase
MLVDFKVKNFRSIKKEQLLSMVASSQKEFINTHIFLPTTSKNLSLVKTAAIYGANAAGKSNILKAMETMQEIVLESSSKYQRGDELPVKPFLFDNEVNESTEFEINFIYNEVRYQYGFATTKERITEEWLIAYPKGRPQNWFARAYNERTKDYKWQFGDKLTGKKQLWQESTRSNALFLSTAVQLNSEQLKPVFDWFAYKLKITGVVGWNPSFTMRLCSNTEYKKNILKFLKMADIDIENIEIEKEDFNPTKLPKDISEELKEDITKDMKGAKFFHLDNYGKKVALDFDDESNGTRKLFSFIGPWIDSLENGDVLLIDELHDNFHPLMVKFLIEMFHNKNINTSRAQLIFTTHETSVLNQDTLRRDQIWFCEKQNKATTLYPLTDFSPRKGVEDLEKGYLSGRYGALPFFQDMNITIGK